MFQFDRAAYDKRMEWFNHDRFGLFIHWGLYAIPARGEWVRSREHMTEAQYREYFNAFNPIGYDPRAWAKAAKAAGMKYAVLTAKHHDGFCLFDSKLTDFKSTNTPCHRDLVREYVEAFRAEGLKVGLYYSLLDWNHPDYPHYADAHHPMRDNPDWKDYKYDFNKYLDYMHGQVRELCENYGKIDVFWFDFSYNDMTAEKWRATELVRMIRSYWPDVIIDSRLEASHSPNNGLENGEPNEYSGDFAGPEQIIPPEGVTNRKGEPIAWEACITMNHHWGYASADKEFKPAGMLVRKLVECVSKGGNLLLNVGPDARGRIPRESLEILAEIGRWMDDNGESIYGCGRSSLPKPEYGRITQKGSTLYYHIFEPQIGAIPLTGLKKEQVKSMYLVRDGSERPISDEWATGQYPDIPFVSANGESVRLPDETDTVIAVELAGSAR